MTAQIGCYHMAKYGIGGNKINMKSEEPGTTQTDKLRPGGSAVEVRPLPEHN